MGSKISSVIQQVVLDTAPYKVAATHAGVLKLDAMEFPTGFPEALQAGWLEKLAEVEINRYPHADNPKIEALIRHQFGISDAAALLFGNGSDELIQLIIWACAKPKAVVLSPAPTFVMYRMNAEFHGMKYVGVDVNPDFSLNMPKMLAAIKAEQPAVIFLSVPNNPTGAVYSHSDIQQILDVAPGLVVVDEAYLPFAEHSAQDLLAENENLLIVRTISKLGYAGLRFGYLFGNPEWVAEINKVRPPYNVNVLTQASVEYLLEHYEGLKPLLAEIVAQRESLYNTLKTWKECEVWPSQANFLVLKTPDSKAWFDKILAQGVLVKNFDGTHPLMKNCLRLTVSNAKETAQLLKALEACRAA